jgi:uncharacterized delta-60 repeat protein
MFRTRVRKLITSFVGAAVMAVSISPANAAIGDLDTDFGIAGKVTTAIETFPYAEVTSTTSQSDGKIIVVGFTETIGGDRNFVLNRYNIDGSPDTSFDTDGVVTTSIGTYSQPNSVVVQTDGKIVVAGYAYIGGSSDFAIARYNTDGSLDGSFGLGGVVTTSIGTEDVINSVSLQADGKIVVAGYAYIGGSSDFAIARYNTNGSLDTSFDSDGKATKHEGPISSAAFVTLREEKIVIAGYTQSGGGYVSSMLRFNANGSLDNTFGTSGIVKTNYDRGVNERGSLFVQSDGKLIIAGNGSGSNFEVARYNSDGSADSTFDTDGIASAAVGDGVDNYGTSIAVQSDGKIVEAGYTNISGSYLFALVRFNSDGSMDNSFGTSGISTTAIGDGGDSGANALTILSNGKIIAAGYAANGPVYGIALARYIGSESTATAPSAPTIGSVSGGDRRLTISFTAGADNGAAITDYEYSLNGGTYISAGTTSSPFTITGLNGRSVYSVTLKSRNSVGLSTASSSLSATTTNAALDASEAATTEAARIAAAAQAADAAKRAKEQQELSELLSVIPSIAGLALNLGDLTNSLIAPQKKTSTKQKCVKGKTTKYVKKGSACPKGYSKKK